MNKNKTMRLIAVTLLAAMIALVLVAGTYAKYTSSASGTDSARVAKWSFTVGGAEITDVNTFEIDLFETIKDTNGAAETDVVAANGEDKVIAPGTQGSFDVELVNNSEVTAKYGIVYTVTNTAGIPVEYSVDDGATWTDTLDAVVAGDDTVIAANGGTETVTVQWRWAYEVQDEGSDPATYTTRDTSDTTLGIAGTAELVVKVDLTATQVD